MPNFLLRVFYYEYWPFWLFFLPMVPYWLYLSLKAKSLTYFTSANPGIIHGGVFGESKMDILNKIEREYLPKTLFFSQGFSPNTILSEITKNGIHMPFIIKPDVGERGFGVEKVESLLQFYTVLRSLPSDFIVQEYIESPVELGVMYYKKPISGETGITSIVQKDFLSIVGDGKSSLSQLLKNNERARLHFGEIPSKVLIRLNEVLPQGKILHLQPIGNHCKGTKFISGNEHISDELVAVFDQIAQKIKGFYFGRFDLRVPSYEDLMLGKNIKIMELNGVTSEPGHIYDPKLNLFIAYRDIMVNMKKMNEVSIESMRLGNATTPSLKLIRLIRQHFSKTTVATSPVKTATQPKKVCHVVGSY